MAKINKKTPRSEDDGGSIVAPSVRVFTEWDPAKLRAAQISASSGNLSLPVAVCDWLLTDDRVVGTLGARLDALFGLEPEFEPAGDRRRSNRAVKALEAGEDWWTAYPESELRRIHSWGLLLGIAPARHVWQERERDKRTDSMLRAPSSRLLPNPRFWHPQTLRYDRTRRTWLIRDDKNVEHVVIAGDGEWILHTPYGATDPWMYGLWRSIANWVLLKHYARLDWARHGEKASLLVATAPDGATKAQRKELAEDLQASGSDRIVALANGFDLKLVEVSANTKEIYDAQVRAADEAIAILIRGGNLSTNVQGGSRAAAESQERTGDQPKLRFDAATLATTLNEQSLAPWALYNFGDAALAPWPAWPVDPEEDLSKEATTVKTLGEGLTILDKLGFELDEKDLKERFRLTFVKGRKTPEQRAKEAQDAMKAAGGGLAPKEGDPEGGKPADPKPPKPPKPKASAGQLTARLASGAPIRDSRGMIAGQLYADDVVESATAAGIAALEPTLEAIGAEIDAASSYEDLRERLQELYPKLEAADLSELVYRAMLLGELAGRAGVLQDA
jgi:hypothetical protein